jgi:hypothetical protein
MGSIYDIYLGRHCALFKHFAYYSIPVLAPNYKQHILSPANVRKICYSLAELDVKFVWAEKGVTYFKHLFGGRKLQKFGNFWTIN